MKNLKALSICLAVAAVAGLLMVAPANGAPGDVVTTINVPVPTPSCCGVSVAVDCDGALYYTNSYEPTLYKIDATGALLSSVPMTKASDGSPISLGELSWDNTRMMLWGGTDHDTIPAVYLVDPTTGVATYQFDIVSVTYEFIDGIAFDGTDNTVWVSDDISTVIDHFDATSGAYLGSLTPLNAAGGQLGDISGLLVGSGNTLYLGRNGNGEIVRIDKTTGNYVSGFATVGGRDEGLECDVINFAPLTVVWSKDTYNNTITAIEVEDGTCACGGGGDLIVDIDIKPTSCPNPLNVKFKGGSIASAGVGNPTKAGGVLPVAVLGSESFDVTQIDPSTVMLEGVAALRSHIQDVSTPVTDGEECECNTEGADGYDDMTLKFDKSDIIAAIGPVGNGDVLTLTLTGELTDGTPFEGSDCVIIRAEKPNYTNSNQLLAAGANGGIAVGQYPNPFNAGTTIDYFVGTGGHVTLTIYNVLGQTVTTLVDEAQEAGTYSVSWDARDAGQNEVPSGVYLYRLQVDNQSIAKTMLLLK